MTDLFRAAKAHVALIGGLATWALATFPDTTVAHVAAAVLAVLTALGVYHAPKRYPKRHRNDAGAVALWPLVVVAVLLGLILGAAGHPWWFLLLLALILLVV